MLNNIERAKAVLEAEFPGDHNASAIAEITTKLASVMVKFAHEHANEEVERRRAAEAALERYRDRETGVFLAGFDDEEETHG